MGKIKNFSTRLLSQKQRIVTKYYKSLILFSLIFLMTPNANAQKGLFVKFSLGTGYTTEYSSINNAGFNIVTKNHAIGWGITDKFALQIGEFGALVNQKVNDYNYINLDAFGLGFSYKTPIDLKVSVLGAYSKVSFAKDWWESGGSDGGNGFGINISIDKEWVIAKRWGLRVGPQLFWLKTNETDYEFFNVSLNGSVVYYLTPVR